MEHANATATARIGESAATEPLRDRQAEIRLTVPHPRPWGPGHPHLYDCTSHYPYAEEQLDLADELGFLVISETPAVGLSFGDGGEQARLQQCIRYTEELIQRDRNHPSVVMWSLANEPMSFDIERALPYFTRLVEVARELDPRPVTVVNPLANGPAIFEICDVICLNRYPGWYTSQGRIEEGIRVLAAELDGLHARFGKPIVITEFGAEAIAGHHAEPPEMFSEEYQAAMIRAVI